MSCNEKQDGFITPKNIENGKVVGRLHLDECGILSFEGNATQAANAFFDEFIAKNNDVVKALKQENIALSARLKEFSQIMADKVDRLISEKDQLMARNINLKSILNTMLSTEPKTSIQRLAFKDVLSRARVIVDQTPHKSLAEHDARVIDGLLSKLRAEEITSPYVNVEMNLHYMQGVNRVIREIEALAYELRKGIEYANHT